MKLITPAFLPLMGRERHNGFVARVAAIGLFKQPDPAVLATRARGPAEALRRNGGVPLPDDYEVT
ncbi:hypothetical protein [Methylobacterium sp. 391_Methyba4]|uniref:hypothetical protein n=1 Tax=Methylobacterium sp. 391_Methyba4 TaxID=3038924 RepID=UPI00241C1C29|nr:hypothetical protein [Methylobacterium sp. 391_Methyba4]WFS09657.1 hypothetical protein P9K36_10390 [Methylobacterium sp. 391_Methyba4]